NSSPPAPRRSCGRWPKVCCGPLFEEALQELRYDRIFLSDELDNDEDRHRERRCVTNAEQRHGTTVVDDFLLHVEQQLAKLESGLKSIMFLVDRLALQLLQHFQRVAFGDLTQHVAGVEAVTKCRRKIEDERQRHEFVKEITVADEVRG